MQPVKIEPGLVSITSPKSIGCCPADETFTIRAGALFLISGNSSVKTRQAVLR
jgi:hypothetical protein